MKKFCPTLGEFIKLDKPGEGDITIIVSINTISKARPSHIHILKHLVFFAAVQCIAGWLVI
jgi:hypothetical protein